MCFGKLAGAELPQPTDPSFTALPEVSTPRRQTPHGLHARMTSVQTDSQREVAALLVEALNLDIPADSIDPQAPLYGEGLGLDSIDILEVALVVSQRYGFQLRSDDEDNIRIFTSLASLTEHITTHRVG
jgi:acyl carrier protein